MSGLGIIIAMAVSSFCSGMALRELLYEFEHGSRNASTKGTSERRKKMRRISEI